MPEEERTENQCPNGCGVMTWETPHNCICRNCNFAAYAPERYGEIVES